MGGGGTQQSFYMEWLCTRGPNLYPLMVRLSHTYCRNTASFFYIASHAVVFRGGSNTRPLKTTTWEAIFYVLGNMFLKGPF